MEETTLKIAMAAFMHDIGKFAGSEEIGISFKETDSYDQQLYLKSHKGNYSHYHALYTAEFIKKYHDLLPGELNSVHWGKDDIFINLAAKHHSPETPLQWIIAIADRVASGWDRDSSENEHNLISSPRNYKKTRLHPIFEQIKINRDSDEKFSDEFSFRYKLAPLSPETIFPGKIKEIVPDTLDKASSEYQYLFDGFIKGLSGLDHRETNIELWFEHFESLMMIYCSHIPAARVGNIIPDVSLYDHSKITAALATSIYLYHAQKDRLNEKNIKSYDDSKFLLINGDFKGIQDYIFSSFSSSEKFRSKILRGRSFAVSLLTELSADLLCRKIGLPFTSVV